MGNVEKPWRSLQVYFQLHSRQKCEPKRQFVSYLRPERSKCDTLKAQNHLLDVTNVGKPLGMVQVYYQPHSGQKCEPYGVKMILILDFEAQIDLCGREIFSVDQLTYPLTANVPING